MNTGTNSAFSDGAWHNLIVSYDGTGHAGVKYYLDGVEEASTADLTGSVGAIGYTLPMEIGAYSSTHSDKYDGQMDEIYVFKGKAITDAEALSIYNAGLAGNQLSNSITTTSGAGTYHIDESGIHDATYGIVTQTQQMSALLEFDFSDSTDWKECPAGTCGTQNHDY